MPPVRRLHVRGTVDHACRIRPRAPWWRPPRQALLRRCQPLRLSTAAVDVAMMTACYGVADVESLPYDVARLTTVGALISRIGIHVWTGVELGLARVWGGVPVRRQRGFAAGVGLRTGQSIWAGIGLRTGRATRLPTARPIHATPDRWARRTGGHRRGGTIRGKPDHRGRNRCAWPWDWDRLRGRSRRRRGQTILVLSGRRRRMGQVSGLHSNRRDQSNYDCCADHKQTHDSLLCFRRRTRSDAYHPSHFVHHLEAWRLVVASSPQTNR